MVNSPNLATDLSNFGISAYDYFQNKKAYNDIIERYRDAMTQNTQASNNAVGLINNAYDASSGYSKNKYDDLSSLINNAQNKTTQSIDNYSNKSNQFNSNNLTSQNAELNRNLNSQKYIVNEGYNASRNDLTGQMNSAINAYNPYTQGGNNAQGLLDKFLTGDPNTRIADYIKTPGYEFRYNEGMNALDKSTSARGNLLGGGAIKEAMKYGQGMAQQGYDNYVDQLSKQSAQGLNATNAQGNLRQGYGTALSNTSVNNANALAGINQNYSNGINQNTSVFNQQGLNNLKDTTSMNANNNNFEFEQKAGASDNRYNDLANIIMGKNQNQANVGLQNQGVLNDILGKIAQEQYRHTSNTKPISDLVTSGGNVLGNILGGGSGGSGGGIGNLFKNILGGSSGGSTGGGSSSDWLKNIGTTIGSWF